MEFAVFVEKLRKEFGDILALDEVSFSVKRGEIFGIVGPDGSGKSTLIRILAGILEPSSGTVIVCGFDMRKDRKEIRKRVGYMSQNLTIYPDLTVMENIKFFAKLHGMSEREMRERAKSLLEMARLSEHKERKAYELSGGMKQKLMLICALIHVPELILLDEPTTGVDIISRKELWDIICGLPRYGTTVIMSTSYMDEAERFTRVGFMYGGKMISCDSPSKMRESVGVRLYEIVPFSTVVRRELMEALNGREGILRARIVGDRVRIVVRPDIDVGDLKDIVSIFGIRSFEALDISMEEIFIQIVESQG